MISSIIYGFFLALLSCCITLNYRIGRFLNLSYGSFFTLGAYISLLCKYETSLILSSVIGFLVGYLMYLTILKFSEDIVDSTLISLGFGIAIEEILRITFRATHVLLTGIEVEYVEILNEKVFVFDLYIFLLSLIFYIALSITLLSSSGLKLKFAEEDCELAEMYGVDVERLRMLVISGSSSIACLCGSILSPMQAIHPAMGWSILVISIMISAISSVFGGIGIRRYLCVLIVSVVYSVVLEVIF